MDRGPGHHCPARFVVPSSVEGELNAWTLALPPYWMRDTGAWGIQGAAVWRPMWTSALRAADYVVLWYDADRASREAVALLRDEFAGAHGEQWVQAHLRWVQTPADANQLHQDGRLRSIIMRAPWIDGSPPPSTGDAAATRAARPATACASNP